MSNSSASNPTVFSTSKMLKHLDRILEVQQTGDTTPFHVSVALTPICNHRCPQCVGAPRLAPEDRTTMPFEAIERLADDFATLNVKAISLGGSGDASTYPRLPEVIRLFHSRGMEVGLITNGQLLREELQEAIVDCCTWVRFSIDADGPELFKLTHGMEAHDWEKVVANISSVVALRTRKGSSVTIGVSYLIGSHTKKGIYPAAVLAQRLGVDYIRMRPFATWDGNPLPFEQQEMGEVLDELKRAASLGNEKFFVSYPKDRTEWVKDGAAIPKYKRCRIIHYWGVVQADGKVYLCCHTRWKDKYYIGNIHEQSFSDLWHSEKRKKIIESIDFKDCFMPCQYNAHNELLEAIDTPVLHENFI